MKLSDNGKCYFTSAAPGAFCGNKVAGMFGHERKIFKFNIPTMRTLDLLSHKRDKRGKIGDFFFFFGELDSVCKPI